MTVGITSYGAHIPIYRFERMAIFRAMGWLTPAIMAVAQGERSACNWDEDAVTMAVAAARDCLKGKDKQTVDALYLASTTLPFSDRQNAGIVSTALNLKDDILTADYTASQKAGLAALVTALDGVKGGDRKNILVAASDKRIARPGSFYEMWFGDGAAAVMVGEQDVIAEYRGSHSVTYDFCDHYRNSGREVDYTWEERWLREEGYSKFVPEAVNGLMDKLGMTMEEVDKLVFPCIFKRDHLKIAKALGAGPDKVVDNMHEVCGETGVAHPLVMFLSALEEAKPGDRILVAGFGQGCVAASFVVTENIRNLEERRGVRGCLAGKKVVDNYPKWLTFREQLDADMGMRTEIPVKTAMTVLYRNRKMLLGLQGGKCRQCRTVQYPKKDVCVNPECGAHRSQDDVELADRPAAIQSFTSDWLAVTMDPPHQYGLVEFEGGGRLLADFTDCTAEDMKVGAPVEMVFRKRVEDKERGFINYFWKAVPLPGGVAKVDFKDRVAIVTGAGAGLGRAYALALAERGAKVVVNDLGGARDGSGEGSASPAEKVVEEITEMGGQAVASYDNVATAEGGENIVKTALDAFGKVDILINNAGILRDKSFLKQDPETWHAVIDVHLNGAYFVTRPAMKAMRENGYGRIVMTTSAAGLYGNFGQTNYTAAKMGIVGLMNSLKIEGRKKDILVNTVSPAAASRLTGDLLPPDLLEKAKPEFVAPLVLYLCSDRCDTTGRIYNAGMGYFNRAAVLTGRAVQLSDPETRVTVETIHENFEKINDLEGAVELGDGNEAIFHIITPPAEEASEDPGGEGWAPEQIFGFMEEGFQPEAAKGMDVVLQFSLSGPRGGEWGLTVKEQTCTIEKGVKEKPACTLKMADQDFVDLLTGKLNPVKALSTGKASVDGDMMQIQVIDKAFNLEMPEAPPGAEGQGAGGLTPARVFERLSETFIPEKAQGVDVTLQYCLSGPNGGDWNVCIRDETCTVAQGIQDKPTCKVTMGDQDFVDLLTGKLNPMKALSSGKVVVEGDMMKMQVLDKVFKLDFEGE